MRRLRAELTRDHPAKGRGVRVYPGSLNGHHNGHSNGHTNGHQDLGMLAVLEEVAPRPSWLLAKRGVDVLLGIPLAILALPIIAVLALGVAISLREWPFFVHVRVGRGRRSFPFPKLRTLPSHTSPYVSKYELEPEIGRFPGFLRRMHLDELPQLLVVPLGWMSLVGPRPEMPDDFMPTPTWYTELRTKVPQGCTGLWQVGVHSSLLLHESPDYDLFYIRHGCVRLDLWILFRTVLMMMGLAGPVDLSTVPNWALSRPVWRNDARQLDPNTPVINGAITQSLANEDPA